MGAPKCVAKVFYWTTNFVYMSFRFDYLKIPLLVIAGFTVVITDMWCFFQLSRRTLSVLQDSGTRWLPFTMPATLASPPTPSEKW